MTVLICLGGLAILGVTFATLVGGFGVIQGATLFTVLMGLSLLASVVAIEHHASTHLTPGERRVALDGRWFRIWAPRRFRVLSILRTTKIPRRAGAWNRMAEDHDDDRIRAMVRANRLLVWPGLFSLGVGLGIVTVAGNVIGLIDLNSLSAPATFTLSGAVALVVSAVMLIPTLAFRHAWRYRRRRRPLAWRLLAPGATLGYRDQVKRMTGAPPTSRWDLRESPVDGCFSVAWTRMLLDPIESEIIMALRPSAKASASELHTWRTVGARKLSFVLESKTHLLDVSNDAVAVEKIFDWLDLVAGTLIYGEYRYELRTLDIANEATAERTIVRARRSLHVGFWQSAAAVPTVFAVIAGVIMLAGILAPMIAPSVLESGGSDIDGVRWVIGSVLVPIALIVLRATFRPIVQWLHRKVIAERSS